MGVLTGQLAGHPAPNRGAGWRSCSPATVLVRAAADADAGLRWARWATPLGWPSRFHACTPAHDPGRCRPPIAATLVGLVIGHARGSDAWIVSSTQATAAGVDDAVFAGAAFWLGELWDLFQSGDRSDASR